MVFRRLAKDSAVYGGADFITKIIAFIAFPIVAAVLSPKAFGVLELIFTATTLLGLVMNCGLNNAVQRFYWDSDTTLEMRPMVVTSGFGGQIVLGVAVVLIGCLAIPFMLPLMQGDGWPLTWVALVAALLVMVLSQWSQYILDVIRLHFAPWMFFVLALSSRAFSIGLGVLAVVSLGLGIDGLLSAQALVLALVLPMSLWLIRKDFSVSAFDRGWLKRLVGFGYPFIYAGLAFWLFGSIDRWMLARMSSVEEVGIYSVAFRFASVVLFVSTAFGQAWSPIAIKIRTDHPDQYRDIYGQFLLLLFFAMLAVGGSVALFSGEIISLVMPTVYLPSALPLAILCFGIILQATQQVTAIGISIENRTHLFGRLAWIAAFVNFIANWLLIPRFGAVGAAWGTVVSYLFLTGSYFYYTQKLHPMMVQWDRLAMLLSMGVLLATASVLLVADHFDWFLVIKKLTLALVCLFIGWVLLPRHSFRKIE